MFHFSRVRQFLWMWPFINAAVVVHLISARMGEDGVDDRLFWLPLTAPRCDVAAKACPLGCSDHGRCIESGVCECHPAWSGDGCEVPRCPKDCGGEGTCLPSGACLCNPGRVGEDCSLERFNLALPHILQRVGSPFTSNAEFAENLDIVMSYKSVHKYGFMLCKTPACKASWDFSLTTIFPSLARDDVHYSYNDCAVVSSSKSIIVNEVTARAAAMDAGNNQVRHVSSGEEIDRHQMIMRLDNAPTKGYEAIVGRRTTHRMVTAEYARHVHGLLGSVIQPNNASTRVLVNSNGWWDSGASPADRLVYLMAVKMTAMGKGEWRAMEKSSLLPFRDVFPGPRKYVLSPVFMSRTHAAWDRLKAAMRDLGLGCYKKKAANTHVPSLIIATLYSLQMCKKINVYGARLDPPEFHLAPAERQPAFHERDTDCCYYPRTSPNYKSDAPMCNHLARQVAMHLLAMSNRVTLK